MLSSLENLVWGPWLILLLLGAGLFITVRTRLIQIRKFTLSWRLLLSGALGGQNNREKTGDISPYQALSSVLANTVGMGNIAGVATAIHLGGPGALFWMWMTALVGMATIYAETYLSVRLQEDRRVTVRWRQGRCTTSHAGHEQAPGQWVSRSRSCSRWRAGRRPCSGDVMIQSNSIAHVFHQQFRCAAAGERTGDRLHLTAMVTIGGIKRIGAVAEKLVPMMILIFIGASIVDSGRSSQQSFRLPETLMTIAAHSAFAPTAAAGRVRGLRV